MGPGLRRDDSGILGVRRANLTFPFQFAVFGATHRNGPARWGLESLIGNGRRPEPRTALPVHVGDTQQEHFAGNGFAVETAQKPQARVQRSPAIMKVAVPLLQHSQWFGHLALSQTVWSFNSSSKPRVRAKLSEVGNLMRSHSGKR